MDVDFRAPEGVEKSKCEHGVDTSQEVSYREYLPDRDNEQFQPAKPVTHSRAVLCNNEMRMDFMMVVLSFFRQDLFEVTLQ